MDNKERKQLTQIAAITSNDPYKFVMVAFPWGKGELARFDGPDKWAKEILHDIRDGLLTLDEAVQIAVASGHGIGKSCFVAWIILWAICTKTDTKGVVTANTENQLKTKTWAEVAKWYRLCIFKDLFKLTATALFSVEPEHEKTWRIDMVPWSEQNTEAFAGLHNEGKRILLVFDEASAISDKIWEVSEGALTDANTQILWLCFGNPTRNTGRFKACFEKFRHRWKHRNVDSRSVKITNKRQLQKWIDDYGEDSDFSRIRIRGVFPRAGSTQFISSDVVKRAQERDLEVNEYAPIIIGVDVARFGDDMSVILVRQGRKVLLIKKYRGLRGPKLGRYVVEVQQDFKATAIFVDGGGVGASVCDYLEDNDYDHVEVAFGSAAHKSEANGFVNKRAEMWSDMRDWLEIGDIPANEEDLATDLETPEYTFDKKMRTLLESKEDMKKRGQASPDIADALAVTFAEPVKEPDPEDDIPEWRKNLNRSSSRSWKTA